MVFFPRNKDVFYYFRINNKDLFDHNIKETSAGAGHSDKMSMHSNLKKPSKPTRNYSRYIRYEYIIAISKVH